MVTRSFHNLTSHYNIFFNGSESYKKGLKRAEDSYEDDYTRLLPIFKYNDENIAQSIAGDMDRTIQKATKVVTLHSITVKPEYKNGPQSDKQKAFYAKTEYIKWVPVNYLVMGKAYLARHDYLLAIQTFKFILTEYPEEEIIYETQIWMARAYNETGEYKESQRILNLLDGNESVSEKLYADLYATVADLRMKEENFTGAIKPLGKALEYVKKKNIKIRYHFILGQLNQQEEFYEQASYHYRQVIKMNPPYTMSFNARINRASVYVTGADRSKDIKGELKKMLREGKNKEYKDQIYYALGDIHWKEGETNKAIDYYALSSAVSVSNPQQKTKSCLTLADIYYDQQNYEFAELYYDTASINLPSDYPDYESIITKLGSLSELVQNLKIVQFEDSVQRLAAMDENERLTIIDSIIAQVRAAERLAQEEEMQAMQDNQYNRMALSQSSSGSQGNTVEGKWYFYNDAAKSFGQPEFKMKWGNRKLEDNWRRSNKREISFETFASDSAEAGQVLDSSMQVFSNKSREFYLQDVPLTDSMMEISHKNIQTALHSAGGIYRNELKDFGEAIDTYGDILERYPNSTYKLSVYYNMYLMYKELQDGRNADIYKTALIREFPESQPAQLLTNPNYINELMEKENEENRFYESTYNKYQEGYYYQVMVDADTAMQRYKESELLPRFFFLKVLSIGHTRDRLVFAEALDSLANMYPGNEVAQTALEMIAYLMEADPVVKLETEKQEAEDIYTADSTGQFFVGYIVDRMVDVNQLKFEIINFNLDHYPNKTFDITNNNLDNNQVLILVKSFANIPRAWEYYDSIAGNELILSVIGDLSYSRCIISKGNATKLIEDKIASRYLIFYNKHYMRRE
ncbi:MAG: tetratricopeptide repeat protein [Bacteroidales bacterium]|nr:tetratricopeptide repeat protein [Bacteroidales bacterium]